MKNNKGFTLIELLSVISILSIISCITIISVSKVLNSIKKNYYISQEKMIVLSGKEYTQDYKSFLPIKTGSLSEIKLNKLVSSKYISNVVDYNKQNCDMDNSYLLVHKTSNNNYDYYAYLKCNNYTSSINFSDDVPVIKITNDSNNYTNPKSYITISDNNYGLASYSYIIFRNGKEIANSGNIKVSNNSKVISFNVNYSKYKDGVYKIKVEALSKYSKKSANNVSSEVVIDTIGPVCGKITGEGSSSNWTKNDRIVSVICSDSGSGCVNNNYSVTFKSSLKKGVIQILDKANNVTNCSVDVYVDKDKPTCGNLNIESAIWTSNKRTFSLKCKDNESGCSSDEFSDSFNVTDSNNTFSVTIEDKANDGVSTKKGNTTNCSINNIYGVPKVGDYVYMKPTSTGYNISASVTGSSKTQSINPSRITLWRILSINSNGTVDLIADTVSETIQFFADSETSSSFVNSPSNINKIASQYINNDYTISARSINNNDIEKVTQVLNTLCANDIDGNISSYWLANKDTYQDQYLNTYGYIYTISNNALLGNTDNTTCISNRMSGHLFFVQGNGYHYQSTSAFNSIRPVLTVKAGLSKITGKGTIDNPWMLK